MPTHRFSEPAVKAVFEAYPQMLQQPLRRLRALILDTASSLPEIGPVEETLKWGQPAYRPRRPRTGTTLRIDALKGSPDGYALFIHCQSRLAAEFREIYPDVFRFDGERALLFVTGEPPPVGPLQHCIALALTYHARRR